MSLIPGWSSESPKPKADQKPIGTAPLEPLESIPTVLERCDVLLDAAFRRFQSTRQSEGSGLEVEAYLQEQPESYLRPLSVLFALNRRRIASMPPADPEERRAVTHYYGRMSRRLLALYLDRLEASDESEEVFQTDAKQFWRFMNDPRLRSELPYGTLQQWNNGLTRIYLWGQERQEFTETRARQEWISAHRERFDWNIEEEWLGREGIIRQVGQLKARLSLIARSDTDRRILAGSYRLIGNLPVTGDSALMKELKAVNGVYRSLLQPVSLGLIDSYVAGFRDKDRLLAGLLDNHATSKLETKGLLRQRIDNMMEFAERPENSTTAGHDFIAELARKLYVQGAEQSVIDSQPIEIEQGLRAEIIENVPVAQQIRNFMAGLEFMALKATLPPAKFDSAPTRLKNETARIYELLLERIKAVDPNLVPLILKGLDDVTNDWPALRQLRIQSRRLSVQAFQAIEAQLIQRIDWNDKVFIGQLLDEYPPILDPLSGVPELFIHFFGAQSQAFIRLFEQQLRSGNSQIERMRWFSLLERMLVTSDLRLRDSARIAVAAVLRSPKVQSHVITSLEALADFEAVRTLLPSDDQQSIGNDLFRRIQDYLRSNPALQETYHGWQLILNAEISQYAVSDTAIDSLFVTESTQLLIASGSNSDQTDVERFHEQASPAPSPERTPEDPFRLSQKEWEELFPVFGTQGTKRQFMELFALRELDDETLPDLWFAESKERAELIATYLEELIVEDELIGEGSLSGSLLEQFGLSAFDWRLEVGALTLTIRCSDGKYMQLRADTIEDRLEPTGDRSAYFEPYLRAWVLQQIFRLLGGDASTVDVIDGLDSIETLLEEQARNEAMEGMVDETVVEESPQSSENPPPIDAFVPFSPSAEDADEAVAEIWKDRVLKEAEEIAEFFDKVLPLPELDNKQLKQLDGIRRDILANIASERHLRDLPSGGVVVSIEGGQWRGRKDWTALTRALRIELRSTLHPDPALAQVTIIYPDNVTIQTVLEPDGFLQLADGIDRAQRTAIELVALRCLEQETTGVIQMPPGVIGGEKDQNSAAKGSATPVIQPNHVLHDDPNSNLRRSANGDGNGEAKELIVDGKRIRPTQRVWIGARMVRGKLVIGRPSEAAKALANDRNIPLITGSSPHPTDSSKRVEIFSTICREHERPIVRKSTKKLTESQ